MSCIIPFCDRLEGRPGDHSCELPPGHAQACRCECEACLLEARPATAPVDPRAAAVPS